MRKHAMDRLYLIEKEVVGLAATIQPSRFF